MFIASMNCVDVKVTDALVAANKVIKIKTDEG
jgi:hypothetical protein